MRNDIGIMKGGAKQEIEIKFSPLEAKVVLSTVIFKFKEGPNT